MSAISTQLQRCKGGESVSLPACSLRRAARPLLSIPYGFSHAPSAMEDAHAAVLNLDETKDSNTFFAVYDGHGGRSITRHCFFLNFSDDQSQGGTVAKFAGQHVHKRLVTEESYHEKQYETALKRAFLGTDEDILASA